MLREKTGENVSMITQEVEKYPPIVYWCYKQKLNKVRCNRSNHIICETDYFFRKILSVDTKKKNVAR